MASSSKETASSSSSSPQWKYSVFLNFRGKDTRKGFVSHLYDALVEQGIPTFKDDKEPEIGNEFPPGLMEAIDGSRIFVVVISPNYASSSWCLNELVKIMECRDKGIGQTVIPVFYNVDPSHVRKQEGTFATAIANHRNSSKERMWRDALTKVATISGLDSRESVDESTLVKELVKEIRILCRSSPRISHMDGLVGIDRHIEKVRPLLSIGSNDVRIIGIWGMGGIGKTTIAEAVYKEFSEPFQGKCFLRKVKESFRRDGEASVIKKLLSEIFMERNLSVPVLDGDSNMLKERLRNIKIIIVIKDVDNLEQLKILPEWFNCFGSGSRIIITTRNKQLLTAHGVEHIYEVNSLENDDALQLFNQKAFRGSPIPEEYSELCERVTFYAKGLPLALIVLGSFLCGRSKQAWESALKKLESIPNPDVHKVLKVSYDDLDDQEKDIFLDIACFFNWQRKDRVIEFLNSCEFSPDIGIPVLIDKSLLTILCETSEMDETLGMHDLLQEMGREIVRQESIKYPNKRSRLWIPNEIRRVLTSNMGSEKIEGILLDLSQSKAMHLGASTFAAMCNLRFLKFYYENLFYSEDFRKCKINLPNGLESLPDTLRYLHWHRYPLTSLPHDFSPDKLGVLSLPHGNIEQLPMDIYKLESLREINLSGCGYLRSFPEISQPMNWLSILGLDGTGIKELHPSIKNLTGLRSLNMNRCKNLEHLPSSIWSLQSLENLFLSGCPNLKGLPSPIISNKLKSLREINLFACDNLRSFPEISGPMHCLESLVLGGTGIKELHPSIEHLTGLRNLYLQDCKNLEHLPSRIWGLKSLKKIDLSGCGNLKSFPEISEPMDCLSILVLDGTGIKELHPSIENLTGLQDLSFRYCKNLERLPSSIWSLESLDSLVLIDCPNLKGLPTSIISSKLKSLTEIWLCDCVNLRNFPEISEPMDCLSYLELGGTGIKELHPSFGNLSGLRFLDMENCKNLERLPSSIWSLKSLRTLRLSDCPNLRALPPIPTSGNSSSVPVDDQTPHQFSSLQNLDIRRNNFESLPENLKELSSLKVLELSGCRKLKSLPELPLSLKRMIADDCISLETVSTSGHSISPKKGLYFGYINCFKLSRNAQSNIVENFLRQTKSTGPPFHENESVNLDMIHGHKVPQDYNSRIGLTVYIPGSEIPEFFSYQSTGSFLTADLPRDWNNSNFMGFAMCAVFEFIGFDSKEDTSKDVNSMNSEEDTSKDVDRMNSDDDNSRNIGNFLVHCHFSLRDNYSCPSSDHIVMGYDANLATKIGGDEQLNSSYFSFKFTVGGGGELRVKKCGVGLIYKKRSTEEREGMTESFDE